MDKNPFTMSLGSLSNILETLVQFQLSSFLSCKLPASQWGFRRSRSMTTALAAAQALWVGHRAAGRVVAIAAFDYSNAFDTLEAGVLTAKLKELVISCNAIRWLADYLDKRRQRVRFRFSTSSLKEVSCGVPQGSILGPLLFITLITDILASLDLGDKDGITVYADNVVIRSAHSNPTVVKQRLEQLAKRLPQFAPENSLSLNARPSCSGPGSLHLRPPVPLPLPLLQQQLPIPSHSRWTGCRCPLRLRCYCFVLGLTASCPSPPTSAPCSGPPNP